jgi:FOG: WD40-like repeat
MKIKNRISAIIISAFLILAMTVPLILMPNTNAAIPSTRTDYPTDAFMDVSPNPVGVGQSVFILGWLLEFDPVTNGYLGNQSYWQGITVTVTDPDGTPTTLGPYTATAAATVGVSYTPTKVGNYTFVFNFPGQVITSDSLGLNRYYEPSNATKTITVQQEPLTYLPQTPLPTDYWSRPVYWTNQQWQVISGNWYGDIASWDLTAGQFTAQSYNAYTDAPLTSHIMWTQPDGNAFGGQIGGVEQNDLSNYYTGKSYEPFFVPPVVINGIMYYNKPSGIQPAYGVYAVDLRTGKQEFYMNITGITYGQVYTQHNPNEVGGYAYLWNQAGSTMSLYDATTGEWILNIVGMPKVTTIMGPNGEILQYSLQTINQTYGYLSMWNSTQCIWANGGSAGTSGEYRPLGTGKTTIQWSAGVQFNTTVPIFSETTPASVAITYVDGGAILVLGTAATTTWQYEAGYSATTGALLWDVNRTIGITSPQITGTSSGWMESAQNGVYVEHNKQQGTYYAFSMLNGTQLWGPTVPDTNPWDTDARDATSDGSAVYIQGPGSVRAYNLTNGDLLWTYTPPAAGLQTPTSTYLIEELYSLTIGGGELFVGTGLSHGDPLYAGSQFIALNTTTGQPVWTLNGLMAQGHAGSDAIADGYFVTHNGYDNQLYCFGQGPSKTTINAPQIGVTTATPVTITGSVTDIAAGSQQDAVTANYPNGLPCVSDASMSNFMEAVYEQQAMPNNITGVPVTFFVLDGNGNYRTIGATTSNALGDYSFTWTPDISGNYTVYAIFAGTGAYYGSSASTGIYASEPPATPTPQATQAPSMADLYFLPAIIGVIIAIVVVGAVLALLVTKKP